MNLDENSAAETSAAATAVAEPTQFDGWDDQGTPIVVEKTPPKKQESEPAVTPAKEAATSENAAEPETATNTQGKKERKPGEKLNRDERIAQLTARTKELEAELERSRAAAPKPPAPTTETAKQTEAPKRPNLTTWRGTVEEYEAAMDKWDAHQRNQVILEVQQRELAKAQNEKMQKELDEVKAKYPDAEDKIRDTFSRFSKVQLSPVIVSMLNDSECLPELMYVLSDETTRNNFIETATKNPGKAIRALAQMEADIRAKQSEQSKTESETKRPAETKPRAPKPPSEERGAAPEDELKTAAASGDFRAFDQAMTRRKFAKSA